MEIKIEYEVKVNGTVKDQIPTRQLFKHCK